MPRVQWHILWLLATVSNLSAARPLADEPRLAPNDASRTGDRGARLAEVVVDGEALFSVRGVTAYPAERRARDIAGRIRALAANPAIGDKSLTIQDEATRTWILANGVRVMALLDEDAAIEDTSRSSLADLYRARIWKAIDEYRQQRQTGYLWSRAAYALVMTLVLLIAVRLGRRLTTVLRTRFERRYQRRMEGLEDRALHMVKAEHVWRALTGLLNLAWVFGSAVMIFAYINHLLGLFPWTRGMAKWLFAIAVDPLRTLGSGFLGTIPNLAFLAVLTLITRYGLKLLRALSDGVAGGTVSLNGFDPEWASPTYRLIRLLVIAFAIVVAYPYIPGSGSDAFKGVSVFIGIIFSVGSSSLIGNFIAGYSMTYRRAFRKGDRVKIGEQVGEVERMRLLVTHLRTTKNEEVVVPNSTILGSEVVNYSSLARERGLILHTTVGIGYETPWRQVEAMLLEAAGRTSGLRHEPEPFVLQTALGDFCVTYEINAFCDTPALIERLYTELHRNVLDVFNEYGVQIMTPAYEADPEHPKVVPKEHWYTAPARAPQIRALR